MASENKINLPAKIMKGPSRMDLLEAMFFDREKILTFDLDKRVSIFSKTKQLSARLKGMIPTVFKQTNVLILSYDRNYPDPQRKEKGQLIVVYDDHSRLGRFTLAGLVNELLTQNPYVNETSV